MATSTDAYLRVVGAIDRNGEDLVFLEQLDGAFRAARRRRHEQRRLVFVPKRPDLGDPIAEAAVHGQRRLTSHVRGRKGRRRPGAGLRRIVVEAERRPARCPDRGAPSPVVPVGKQLGRRQRPILAGQRGLVALLKLFDQLRPRGRRPRRARTRRCGSLAPAACSRRPSRSDRRPAGVRRPHPPARRTVGWRRARPAAERCATWSIDSTERCVAGS